MCSTVQILNVIIFLWHHLKVLKRALIIKHKDWNKSRDEGDDENFTITAVNYRDSH